MNRKELIERELEDLDQISNSFQNTVQDTLSVIRNTRSFLYLKQPDRYRLLILKSWIDRYNVSLRYILETVLPFWESFVQKRSPRLKGRGLNVRVSTLTGKKSESILQEQIKKDFPNGANYVISNNQERERIISRSHYLDSRHRDLDNRVDNRRTKIGSLERLVRHYRYTTRKESKYRMKLSDKFQERPYRTNPFLD
jgi:hypothetical protein